MTLLTEGHDGLILEVDSGYERPLADAILPIQNAPISANIQNYLSTVEVDLERVIGTSPAARGIVTKATAYEVETVQQYTESEFGLHAAIKDQWLANLTELMMRALISCMQDDGDSSGAFEAQSVDVAEVGASAQDDQPTEPEEKEPETFDRAKIISLAEMIGVDVNDDDFKDLASKITMKRELDDMTEEELNLLGSTLAGRTGDITKAEDEREKEQTEMALVRNTAALQEPLVDDSVVPPLGLFEDDDSYKIVSEQILLRDRNEQIVVSAEDLDANFLISFVEGGRTPLSDAAMQQNLVALLEPYSALWQTANQGGPVGVFARNYMKVLAERFELPKDLHPEELDAELKMQEQEQPDQASAPPDQPEPQPPEDGGTPPDQQAEGAPSPQDVVAQLSQMPPDQALLALNEMFADNPQVMQVVQQIQSLPPEEQPGAIAQFLEALSANL
jgi:hypothetical protein